MVFDFKVRELVSFARENCKFYRDLYAELPISVTSLSELPILNPDEFWNSFANNRPTHDGLVFKKNLPKSKPNSASVYSVFSKSEWNLVTQVFGRGISAGTLKRGDRVANLFNSGNLSDLFLLVSRAIDRSPIEVLHLPITSSATHPEIISILNDFRVNILIGEPSHLVHLAQYILKHDSTSMLTHRIEQILLGGAPATEKQIQKLRTTFPGVYLQSIGWFSKETGLLGYSDQGCSMGEYRVFSEATSIEIIDPKSGQCIEETGRPGKVVTTQLFRHLMPIIRYPTGYWAAWLEPAHVHDRKFRLLLDWDSAKESTLQKYYPSREHFQPDLRFHHEAEQFAGK